MIATAQQRMMYDVTGDDVGNDSNGAMCSKDDVDGDSTKELLARGQRDCGISPHG